MNEKVAKNDTSAAFIGRVWDPKSKGPVLVKLVGNDLIDITSKDAPFMRDITEMDDAVGYVRNFEGKKIASYTDLCQGTDADLSKIHLLSPIDLQVIRACGVTFIRTLIERIIEEKAGGMTKENLAKLSEVRTELSKIFSDNLNNIKPGTKQAALVKEKLIEANAWSQYLEVAIGPDAEVFTKAPVLSSVGSYSKVGIHPESKHNNTEPEMVFIVNSKGKIVGGSMGNDMNLRDFESRSALLLSKAKDNNASCAIGPFIRLFDENFSLDDLRSSVLEIDVEGLDGFVLKSKVNMSEISRDPANLVSQVINENHQYPDGFVLFSGTFFKSDQDRGVKGEGFTHKTGDKITISCEKLGSLVNFADSSANCRHWTFGIREIINNYKERGLI